MCSIEQTYKFQNAEKNKISLIYYEGYLRSH